MLLPSSSTWNDKNLDYEIETLTGDVDDDFLISLKRQEPRLRDWNIIFINRSILIFITWNDKNLDYEIETW